MWIFLFSFLNLQSMHAFALPIKQKILMVSQSQLKSSADWNAFYSSLKNEYGPPALSALHQLALDEKNAESARWISIFAIAKIGEENSFHYLKQYMNHSHWMIRDAALKAAAAIDAQRLSDSIQKRLQDPALAVRTTAVQVIQKLNLKSAAPKLVAQLHHPMNYYDAQALQKPLWIHKYILQALLHFDYQAATPDLVKLLEKIKEPRMQRSLLATLAKLNHKDFSKKSTNEQLYLWKRHALSDMTF